MVAPRDVFTIYRKILERDVSAVFDPKDDHLKDRIARAEDVFNFTASRIRGAPKFDISNVFDYWYRMKDRPGLRSMPCIAPPFTWFWMEGELPRWWLTADNVEGYHAGMRIRLGTYWGGIDMDVARGAVDAISNTDLEREEAAQNMLGHVDKLREGMSVWAPLGWQPPEVKWVLHGENYYWRSDEGEVSGPMLEITILLDRDGIPLAVPDCDRIITEERGFKTDQLPLAIYTRSLYGQDIGDRLITDSILPPMFAVSLLHCRNVKVKDRVQVVDRDRTTGRRRRTARVRRGKKAKIRYHILDIPVGKKPEHVSADKSDSRRDPVAFHMVRGHYKDYRHGAGLGRYGAHGIWWWDAHVRGSKQAGVVLKDYREVPQDEQP